MEIVNVLGLKPDKDYGQNFLLDPEVCRRIVSLLEIEKNDSVLEVGPGLGSLTHFLALETKPTVCDIDNRMINFLEQTYKDGLNYICDDIRKVDVSSYDRVIGNLPYNITSELIVYLLTNCKNAKKLVLMAQREAVDRIFDLSGKEYGPLSIYLRLYSECKKEFSLKPSYFYPAPKCISTVFTVKPYENVDKGEIFKVYKLAKALFLNRRKTIYNNLKNYLANSDKAKNILDSLNILLTKRPEEISPDKYLDLYRAINEYNEGE